MNNQLRKRLDEFKEAYALQNNRCEDCYRDMWEHVVGIARNIYAAHIDKGSAEDAFGAALRFLTTTLEVHREFMLIQEEVESGEVQS